MHATRRSYSCALISLESKLDIQRARRNLTIQKPSSAVRADVPKHIFANILSKGLVPEPFSPAVLRSEEGSSEKTSNAVESASLYSCMEVAVEAEAPISSRRCEWELELAEAENRECLATPG